MLPIFHAILGNDVPAFLSLVDERESSLEEISEDSNTVLHMAVKLGHEELVSKIIELRPSLIYSSNTYGDTPLHLAVLLGDVKIVMTMLEFGSEVCSARNNNNETPFHLACCSTSTEVARLVAQHIQSICLTELDFAISSGMICIVGIILERFPDIAREEAWEVEDGSLSTLLHQACDKGDLELTSILLGLGQRLEEALNTSGLSPLHLAVLTGSVVILEEFAEKAPFTFSCLTPSKETVFHLAARNKNFDAFVFMANSKIIRRYNLIHRRDENGNTVLHIAATVACHQIVSYVVGSKKVGLFKKNKMGFSAFQLIPEEIQEFELLSGLLTSKTSKTLDSINNNKKHEQKVIQLLRRIGVNTFEVALRMKSEKAEAAELHGEVKRDRDHSLEYKMHIEALQNARNTIAIVAVLIASVTYAGGINPPGGVNQDGPGKGKSIVGKTTAFKVFAICNNMALFTSLCIVILLVSIIPYKRKPLKKLLVVTHRIMWVSIGFMATAYVAASWVTIPHYHGTRWLFPAIIAFDGGALTALLSFLVVVTIGHWFNKKNHLGVNPSFAHTSSDLAASEVAGIFPI